MRHFRLPRPKDLRELRRIKSSQGKIGSAIGKGSEDFFEGVLTTLLQRGKIKGFRRTIKWSPDDRYGGTDFFITDLNGREYRVDIKSSKARTGMKRPDIVYIVIGLYPKEKKILRQLQNSKIIPKEKRRQEPAKFSQLPLRKEGEQDAESELGSESTL